MLIPKARGYKEPRILRVLGALLGGSPEEALLRQSVRPPIALQRVENRLEVVTVFREYAPDVVVFSVNDRNRLSTSPLISACARERPGGNIVLLCAAPPTRSGAILAAARAGARVLVTPNSSELSAVFERMARSLEAEHALTCEALATVHPPMLRQLLCVAADTVAGDGRVDTFAQNLSVSTRTLNRYTRHTARISPKGLLSAVRLLWACAMMESASRDVKSVARATGFAGPSAMRAAIGRHLAVCIADDSRASLPGYRDALQDIVGALGGRLAT